ncbi:MAG: hypothetical protein U0133_17425 [Gemmatimonadales bacterium]
MSGQQAGAKRDRIDQYLALLRDSLAPEPGFLQPAKQMSKEQARDCYLHYLAWGKFELKDRDALFTLDAQGTLQPPSPTAKVTIWPPVIAGVEWLYLLTIDKKGNKSTLRQAVANLDARNVVFLVRLSELMRWQNANKIFHIGFVFDAKRQDCHGQGRACDFAGAGGDGWEVTVAQHWGGQPIVMPIDWTSPEGKRYTRGQRLPDWPPAPFNKTTFRLDPSNPYLDPTLTPDLARQIFSSAYQHAITEGADTSKPVMSSIGVTSDIVFHPDHPTSNPDPLAKGGREAHWQHIHMQIGPTQSE